MKLVFKLKGRIMSLAINANTHSPINRMTIRGAPEAAATPIPRLSSGLSIGAVRAAAAADSITEGMRSQSRELGIAWKNAEEVSALATLADKALDDITRSFTRMRELTVQSSNPILSSSVLDNLNKEFLSLKTEILRMSGNGIYNDNTLFDLDAAGEKRITSGDAQLDLRHIALISSLSPDDGILTRSSDRLSLTSEEFEISSSSSALQRSAVVGAIDAMMAGVKNARATIGAFQGAVNSQIEASGEAIIPSASNNRRPIDLDFSSENMTTRDQILQQAAKSELFQQARNPVQAMLRMLHV